MTFKEILSVAQKSLATDIYISPSKAIYIKSRDQIKPITSANSTLSNEQIIKLIKKILSEQELEQYKEKKSLLIYYSVKEISLYKLYLSEQEGLHSLHFQPMSSQIPDSKNLNTTFLDGYSTFRKGLMLFLGAKHSGKTHTLNAFLNMANIKTQRHISLLSRQNPWVHSGANSLISSINYTDNFIEVFNRHLNTNPDMIFIDDLNFNNFLYLLENYDFNLPTVISLQAGSAYQFLRRIKNNKITNTFRNCLYILFHQKLIFSAQAGTQIPIFESVERSRELDRFIDDEEIFAYVNNFSELNRKQRGDHILPIENYLAKMVKAQLISSQQALQFCDNQPYLLKKISTVQNSPLSAENTKTEIGELDRGWTNIENISLASDDTES